MYKRFVKRCLDFVLSLIALIILSPVLLIVIADIAKLNGYNDIVFLDDNEAVDECAGYPVIGRSCDFAKVEKNVVIAIGNAKIRSRI